mmetsp:Transcript_3773/g.4868  ORF Transcript_3773/g.4868 Transcript_3773/m.4868 type:complete len:116 (-) Transcript_3773:240-587(-)
MIAGNKIMKIMVLAILVLLANVSGENAEGANVLSGFLSVPTDSERESAVATDARYAKVARRNNRRLYVPIITNSTNGTVANSTEPTSPTSGVEKLWIPLNAIVITTSIALAGLFF